MDSLLRCERGKERSFLDASRIFHRLYFALSERAGGGAFQKLLEDSMDSISRFERGRKRRRRVLGAPQAPRQPEDRRVSGGTPAGSEIIRENES